MTLALRTAAVALATLVLLGACSSGPPSGGTPAASLSASGRASAAASAPPSAAAAGGPCSYLTAQEVGAILGATPVEVEPVNVGDEAYSIFNESIGTVVVARKGDAVVAVQVYVGDVPADQLRQATALVEAVLAGL